MKSKLNRARFGALEPGYASLPPAVDFGCYQLTGGFGIHEKCIEDLRASEDRHLEISNGGLRLAVKLGYTAGLETLREANTFFIAKSTPMGKHGRPDFTFLIKASEFLDDVIKKNDE